MGPEGTTSKGVSDHDDKKWEAAMSAGPAGSTTLQRQSDTHGIERLHAKGKRDLLRRPLPLLRRVLTLRVDETEENVARDPLGRLCPPGHGFVKTLDRLEDGPPAALPQP